MTWLFISLTSAAFMGLVGISDKIVIHRYAKTPLTLLLLISITQTTVGIVLLFFGGIPNEANLLTSTSAFGSGVFHGFAGFFLIKTLFSREVSRTIPVTQSAPIFTALLAFFILGETISLIQYGGITIAVLGSALITLSTNDDTHGVFLHKSFYSLMFSAFLFGTGIVIGKMALEELPVLYTHGLRTLATALIFLCFALRAEPWADVKSLFSKRSPALLLVAINDFITAQVGLIMLLLALSLGPASLVASVTGTRALFTVIYSMSITKVWPGALGEDISRGSILIKLFSTVLIVAGITAMSI